MTNDLDRDLRKLFLRHETDVAGRGLTPPQSLVRRTRRRQAATLLVVSIAAAAVAIAGIAGLDAIRASEGRPAIPGPRPGPGPEPRPAPVFDLERVPAVSIDEDAIVNIRTGQITALPASIASFPDATGYAVAPGGEVLLFEDHVRGGSRDQIFVANVDGTDLRLLTDAHGGAIAGGWSADGSAIVAILDDGVGRGDVDLVLIDVATGETTQLARGRAGDFQQPHFSPDGQLVLFTRFQKYRELEGPEDQGSDVFGIPVIGGKAALVFEDRWNATFSPDGRTMAYTSLTSEGDVNGPELWLADADGSDPRPLVLDQPFSDNAQWSPDGSRIAYSRLNLEQHGVVVLDMPSATPTLFVQTPRGAVGAWLDDSTLLVDIG